ncbi:hypothetical protein Q5752_002793 [Cryptotrichosporon argae]
MAPDAYERSPTTLARLAASPLQPAVSLMRYTPPTPALAPAPATPCKPRKKHAGSTPGRLGSRARRTDAAAPTLPPVPVPALLGSGNRNACVLSLASATATTSTPPAARSIRAPPHVPAADTPRVSRGGAHASNTAQPAVGAEDDDVLALLRELRATHEAESRARDEAERLRKARGGGGSGSSRARRAERADTKADMRGAAVRGMQTEPDADGARVDALEAEVARLKQALAGNTAAREAAEDAARRAEREAPLTPSLTDSSSPPSSADSVEAAPTPAPACSVRVALPPRTPRTPRAPYTSRARPDLSFLSPAVSTASDLAAIEAGLDQLLLARDEEVAALVEERDDAVSALDAAKAALARMRNKYGALKAERGALLSELATVRAESAALRREHEEERAKREGVIRLVKVKDRALMDAEDQLRAAAEAAEVGRREVERLRGLQRANNRA